MIKNQVILLGMLFLCLQLTAQRNINEFIAAKGIQKLQFNFEYADVTIKTHKSEEVKVNGTVNINQNGNNEAFQLESKVSNGRLSLETYIKDIDKIPGLIEVVTKDGQKLFFRSEKKYWEDQLKEISDQIKEKDIKSFNNGVKVDVKLEITIPEGKELIIESNYGDVALNNMPASTKIHCTYGGIEATLNQKRQLQKVKLHSTYSYIDIKVAKSLKATLDLESDYGKILTDLDFNIDKQKSREKSFSSHIVGNLNGGGPTLRLVATYDNIYVRGD